MWLQEKPFFPKASVFTSDGEGIAFNEKTVLIIWRSIDFWLPAESQEDLDCVYLKCQADFEKKTIKILIPSSHKKIKWRNKKTTLYHVDLTRLTSFIEDGAMDLGFDVTFERQV